MARKPRIIVLEEVTTWAEGKYGHPSACDVFIQELKKARPGTGVSVHILNQSPWQEVSRPRVYLIAFAEAAGGQSAADECSDTIDLIIKYRQDVGPPTPLLSHPDRHGDECLLSHTDIADAKKEARLDQIMKDRLLYLVQVTACRCSWVGRLI